MVYKSLKYKRPRFDLHSIWV